MCKKPASQTPLGAGKRVVFIIAERRYTALRLCYHCPVKKPLASGSRIGVGIALGAAIGAAMHHVGLGVALGVVFGTIFRRKNKNSDA
ncbi:MAG: hypothetical protein RL328_207 [Acidobacteriota bacterium]